MLSVLSNKRITKRSSRVEENRSISCDERLFGSGSLVTNIVIAVNVKPHKRANMFIRLDR